MEAPISVDKLRFLLFRFKEKLWVRPLTLCILSICAVFFAKLADLSFLACLLYTSPSPRDRG